MRQRARLAAALPAVWPLCAAYLALAALYGWQAWQRLTPTLFSDEIEFTQFSRSIADTGHAVSRTAGASASLYEYLAAPAWWLDDPSSAYGAIKLLGVLLMTAAIFPAYGIARLVVSRPYALFAAVGAAAVPALSYSPFLVEEPLAYPVSTLALLLIARAAASPTRLAVGAAVGACILALYVRTQLAVLLPVLAVVFAVRLWRGDRFRRWRGTWTAWDWVGAAALAVGLAVVLSAAIGRRSSTWYVATGFNKSRMLEYGLWAGGALAIGIGVLPLIATLVALVRPRDEPRNERTDAFVATTVAALAAFGLYTAVKAAYLSRTFALVIAERNLIYLCPLLFAGTALALERRRASIVAIVAATAFAVYLVVSTPYALDRYPNYEAHGLAIAALANRIPRWPADTIETALVLVALGSGLALASLRLLRGRTGLAAAAAIGGFVLAWSLTTEIYAANGERRASDQQYATLPKPPSWVEAVSGGRPAIFVGQGVSDPNPIRQLEFWNPSIRWYWGLDGSTPDGVTPNLLRADGTLDPADLGAELAVASKGLQLAAPKVSTVGDYELYRLGGEPVRLSESSSGISADGWMGEEASYTRYDVTGLGRGFVKVVLSREAACFPQLEPAEATVTVGRVEVNRYDQPGIARVTAEGRTKVRACQANPVLLRVPAEPWRVEVRVEPTFSPHELDPDQGDRRELGARPTFTFVPF